MKLQKYNSAIVLILLISACSVGEDYEKPALELPASWSAIKAEETNLVEESAISESETAIKSTEKWWEKFHDAKLNELISTAEAANNDLNIAKMRVLEARANEDSTDSNFYPQIDAVASITREKLNDITGSKPSTFKQAGLSGNWDIDVFGRNRRLNEAANANIEASMAEHDNAYIVLVAEVARNYILYRGYQQQYLITQRNIELQSSTMDSAIEQRRAGAVSDLDVTRASAQVKSSEARLPQIRTASYACITRLMTLTNQPYSKIYELLNENAPIPEAQQHEIVATPIEAIRNRPDIVAAERRLAEATALKASAFAGYFPRLSLDGFIGFSDSSLFGSASPWTFGANALMPILNFGRISSQVDVADARKMQAFYNYRQVTLLAIEDVENALVSYVNEIKRAEKLAEVVESQKKSASIAREQYTSGVTTQLDVLTAERGLLDAESEYTTSQTSIAEKLVVLYRALGR